MNNTTLPITHYLTINTTPILVVHWQEFITRPAQKNPYPTLNKKANTKSLTHVSQRENNSPLHQMFVY